MLWGLEEKRQSLKQQILIYLPCFRCPDCQQSYIREQGTLTIKISAETVFVSWVILWISCSVMNILVIVVLSGRFCGNTALWT